MSTFSEFYKKTMEEGVIDALVSNRFLQFGSGTSPYLGAELLPEEFVSRNSFRVNQTVYRNISALDGSRYSAAQLQKGSLSLRSLLVDLAYQNTADQLTAEQIDDLVLALRQTSVGGTSADAILINFYTDLNNRLLVKNEKDRFECLIHGRLTRRGVNGYYEDLEFPRNESLFLMAESSGTVEDPTGWYANDESYDPLEELLRMRDSLEEAGYQPGRILTTRGISNALYRNPLIRRQTSNSVQILTETTQRPSMTAVNGLLASNELPPLTVYSGGYYTRRGFRKYMQPIRTPMGAEYLIMTANTGQNVQIENGEDPPITIDNTLGRYAIGTVTQATSPGRVANSKLEDLHPKSLYAEIIQAGLPILDNVDAIAILRINRPAPDEETAEEWDSQSPRDVIPLEEAIRISEMELDQPAMMA